MAWASLSMDFVRLFDYVWRFLIIWHNFDIKHSTPLDLHLTSFDFEAVHISTYDVLSSEGVWFCCSQPVPSNCVDAAIAVTGLAFAKSRACVCHSYWLWAGISKQGFGRTLPKSLDGHKLTGVWCYFHIAQSPDIFLSQFYECWGISSLELVFKAMLWTKRKSLLGNRFLFVSQTRESYHLRDSDWTAIYAVHCYTMLSALCVYVLFKILKHP